MFGRRSLIAFGLKKKDLAMLALARNDVPFSKETCPIPHAHITPILCQCVVRSSFL